VADLAPIANCVAWLREGDEEHDGCVTVICNGKGDGEKKIEVGKDHAGEKWTDALGWHQREVTIDEGVFADLLTTKGLTMDQRAGQNSSARRRVFLSGPRLTPMAGRSSRADKSNSVA
jgi:ABC-type phosphonate transport system ATPase subunit